MLGLFFLFMRQNSCLQSLDPVASTEYNTSSGYLLFIGRLVQNHFHKDNKYYIIIILDDPNLAKCGFILNEEAVMSESGIFLVSIPRLSMQTGPGGRLKPVNRHKKKHRTQLKALSRMLLLV